MTTATMTTEVQDFGATTPSKEPAVRFTNIDAFQDSSTVDPPENFLLDNFESLVMRPRSKSHHLSSTKIPSRLWLKIQARFWRSLMAFAMTFPKLKAPRAPKPSFVRKITTSPHGSKPIVLYFYTPPNYERRRAEGHQFPVVVNFHGGGFCLGAATDDRHWARIVLQHTPAVFVSVGYRLAPEHPFPGPVDDCVDALLWLSSHAKELGLDTTKTALSGFSAGANLVFSVPLRLEYYTKKHESSSSAASSPSSGSEMSRWPSTANLLANSLSANLKITTVVAWYPILDWTLSRASKKRSSRRPSKTLPKLFTDLFDFAYLPPPDLQGHHCSPYASPGLAPDYMIRDGLPHDIQMWLCEWDMLLGEGQRFSKRLESLGKNVEETLIPEVPHGFDQSPNPWRDQARIDKLYMRACEGLRDAFGL